MPFSRTVILVCDSLRLDLALLDVAAVPGIGCNIRSVRTLTSFMKCSSTRCRYITTSNVSSTHNMYGTIFVETIIETEIFCWAVTSGVKITTRFKPVKMDDVHFGQLVLSGAGAVVFQVQKNLSKSWNHFCNFLYSYLHFSRCKTSQPKVKPKPLKT